MNKCLEALKDLEENVCYFVIADYAYQRLNIIEKELKRLEEIDEILNTGGGIWAENGIVSKKLKALEIIKGKGIILQFIKETYTVEEYNIGVDGTLVKPLTQDEYALLKETLP